ncbi:unnamed protein product [Prorocentrum cordatum]|uniref:Uncharacterized protein n=1 Tax=Prorocentrum cordatum TaxID=2364126 RepID=A0ABN9VRC7_9DINO|nr:unnamed protein product [Polarella glacialis]
MVATHAVARTCPSAIAPLAVFWLLASLARGNATDNIYGMSNVLNNTASHRLVSFFWGSGCHNLWSADVTRAWVVQEVIPFEVDLTHWRFQVQIDFRRSPFAETRDDLISQSFAGRGIVSTDLNNNGIWTVLSGGPAVIHCDPVDDDLDAVHIPVETPGGKIYFTLSLCFLAGTFWYLRQLVFVKGEEYQYRWLHVSGLVPVLLYLVTHMVVAFRPAELWWDWSRYMMRSPGSVKRVEVQGVRSGIKLEDIKRFALSYLQVHHTYLPTSDNCQAYARALAEYVGNGGTQLLIQTVANAVGEPFMLRFFVHVCLVISLFVMSNMFILSMNSEYSADIACQRITNMCLSELPKRWADTLSNIIGLSRYLVVLQLCISVVCGMFAAVLGDVSLLPICIAMLMFGLWSACSGLFFGLVDNPPPLPQCFQTVAQEKAMLRLCKFYVITYLIVAVLYCTLPDVRQDIYKRNHTIAIMENVLSLFWIMASAHLLYTEFLTQLPPLPEYHDCARALAYEYHAIPSEGTTEEETEDEREEDLCPLRPAIEEELTVEQRMKIDMGIEAASAAAEFAAMIGDADYVVAFWRELAVVEAHCPMIGRAEIITRCDDLNASRGHPRLWDLVGMDPFPVRLERRTEGEAANPSERSPEAIGRTALHGHCQCGQSAERGGQDVLNASRGPRLRDLVGGDPLPVRLCCRRCEVALQAIVND